MFEVSNTIIAVQIHFILSFPCFRKMGQMVGHLDKQLSIVKGF